MDPIELLQLCLQGSKDGAPDDLFVPRIFSTGDFENVWRTDRTRV